MRIKLSNKDLNILLNSENHSKTELGWSDSFQQYEDESLRDIINPVENYETVRYIHEPYTGITSNASLTQSDIWFYFYFISGATYNQSYESVGISNKVNSELQRQSSKSFFRLEFYKTPNNESPNRNNRKLVFSKNLTLPLGEKFFLTADSFNKEIYVPVFNGNNYKNKENMYLFWFADDTAFSETLITGNTFYMSARFFNAIDGSVIEFTNKNLSIDNSLLIDGRIGKKEQPVVFYEKGITGSSVIDEQNDMYYRMIINRNNGYTYKIIRGLTGVTEFNQITPTPTPTPTNTSIVPTPTSTSIPIPTSTPSSTLAPTPTALPCYQGASSANGTCSAPDNQFFTLNGPGQVDITAYGYFTGGALGSTTRYAYAYLKSGVTYTDTIVTFTLTQVGSNTATVSPSSYTLSAIGNYKLQVDQINCNGASNGVMNIVVTACY